MPTFFVVGIFTPAIRATKKPLYNNIISSFNSKDSIDLKY